jgi:asparagine synthase (glutamine-hydrolysing)
MCGIAGFLTNDANAPKQSLIEGMCETLVHRGPDGCGYFTDQFVALGHRRLSIIDLVGGTQPLGNEDGRIQVVFNGEIYNYVELRSDLISRGHRFSTNSDTETLVHLYEEYGEQMAEHLNGMFAFAIWDANERQLFIARDRFGKKPLYYAFDAAGMRFCFASELKAITGLPGFTATVDEQSIADFLTLSYIPDPQTVYRSVRKLEPGHTLLITSSGSRIRRYWRPEYVVENSLKLDEVVEQIRELAADSVSRRMIADVPLGAFLSGGVDSGAVVAFMAQRASCRVKTFSIGFTSKEFDELDYARQVVKRYGTDHYEEIVTPDILEVLDTLVYHYDEPFGDSSAIPTLYLSRMTRRHVTVALSGDGADELFGGYRRYRFGVLEDELRKKFPGWFRNSVVRLGAKYYPKFDYLPRVFRAKTLLNNLTQDLSDSYLTSMSTFRDEGLYAVLSPELRQRLAGYSCRDTFRRRFTAYQHLPPLQQMQAVDLETYLPGGILVKADRATMAYSLESRSPWLDFRLGELSFRLPQSLKLNAGVGKYTFKAAVAPMLPSDIIQRPKMGFAVPLAEWFRTSLRPVFEAKLRHSGMAEYISRAEVNRIWQEHQSRLHNHDRKLWNLLMLACWHTRHHHLHRPTPLSEVVA